MTKEQKFSNALAIQVERRIFLIRGQNVMLDFDLAELYGVETRALKQAVRRNFDRFPADFMFELSAAEIKSLVSQTVIPTPGKKLDSVLPSTPLSRRKPGGGGSTTSGRGRSFYVL